MKRLIAVVVAVVMVVGAVLLRDRIDGDDGSGSGRSGDQLRLVCDTDLAEVCDGLSEANRDLDVVLRDSGTTADELSSDGGALDGDAWLTTAAWPAIVADNRSFGGLGAAALGDSSSVLARSPVMIATLSRGRADLEAACGGTITWRCVGEQSAAGQRAALAPPESGAALTVLAAATDSWFGGDDYSTGDFDDPAFGRWFDELTRASSTKNFGRQSPLERAVSRTGEFTSAGALEAETSQLLPGVPAWVPIYAEPMVTADVVLVPAEGLDAPRLLDDIGADGLRDALAAQGWRIDGRAPSGALDPPVLLDSSGLPAPGVLQSLRDRW